ncbi:MAG: helix-turn-helix transcriptional regulator [Maricaulis sp.]|jgi:transcriptional regulator with XRE-family HTH domain|uniref:helix-turn-helix domain-containing protein n=1 Tax=Maricaulis sp. TaxID=1486257 RepID=UPI001B2B470C|nr:helix-turn-helix transcriptional regulator [Maricaulis sp.]MBO6728748.1 helix-turn-helix transcriptional regulator [Maricaulis sp.]MBO6847815.1 helix-turn-helix transcriptional regulator [Maricaulis sp.]MBO6877438.1 helix-turn-helix transcriptional regulator [Maricaulis sp.]MDM7983504.1 helix-turn-helix transcriptional regulator [Maricaulis sp.]
MSLKSLRLERGWSQAELAEISDLSVRTIQRIEKGHTPSLEAIKALASSFALSAGEFQQHLKQTRGKNMSDPLSHPEMARGLIPREFERLFWHTMVFAGVMTVIAFVTYQLDVTPRLGWGVGMLWAGVLFLQLAWVLFCRLTSKAPAKDHLVKENGAR